MLFDHVQHFLLKSFKESTEHFAKVNEERKSFNLLHSREVVHFLKLDHQKILGREDFQQ